MPRAARIIPARGFLHIISRGNNRRKLFLYPRDFRIYYTILTKLKREVSLEIFHYCLMPNHVHLLIGVRENSELSTFMKRLNLKYFYYYRKKHHYVGHLWQDRFKSKLIEKDEYFIQCGKYIELNPTRAGIVEKPQDYPYSSYLHYGFGGKDNLIDEDPFYMELGPDSEARQTAYRNIIIRETENIKKVKSILTSL